jgi:spore coat polysaccharide biosynthesis predicted glycosyltransferase SpsG
VIDDVADRAHDCDILLDQNLHEDPAARYANRLPPAAVRLLGPRYALLRDEFPAARRVLRLRDGVVKRLLISFGGTDADNLTGRVLDLLTNMRIPGVSVDIVIGASSPYRDELRRRYADAEGVTLHDHVSNMARLMQDADLAIGAAGSTTWERCALGLPSIVVPLADNQIPTLRALANAGVAFIAAGEVLPADHAARAISPVLDYALHAPGALRHQSQQALAVTDGKGAGRVARQMCLPEIACRKAAAADTTAIHAWRNSPEIRRSSRQSEEIDFAVHVAWFERMLADPDVDLLICELAGEPVGVLRYDRRAEAAVVSIYLVPTRLGASWGDVVLAAGESWLRANRPGVKVLHAEVRAENSPSLAMFGSSGYARAFEQLEKRIVA